MFTHDDGKEEKKSIDYLGSIFGIIEIITKHVFPTDEEKYVNDMVKTIIETDLRSHIADKDDTNSNNNAG